MCYNIHESRLARGKEKVVIKTAALFIKAWDPSSWGLRFFCTMKAPCIVEVLCRNRIIFRKHAIAAAQLIYLLPVLLNPGL